MNFTSDSSKRPLWDASTPAHLGFLSLEFLSEETQSCQIIYSVCLRTPEQRRCVCLCPRAGGARLGEAPAGTQRSFSWTPSLPHSVIFHFPGSAGHLCAHRGSVHAEPPFLLQ